MGQDPQLTQIMNAVQEAQQSVHQAEASGNVQQVYEAKRRLYLAEQQLQQIETGSIAGTAEAEEQFQQAQEQFDRIQQSMDSERLE